MSRKLEDNGRWESSRMMLPEHREQYLEKHRATAAESIAKRIPTKEELTLVRDSVLLPMILTIVDNNRRELELSTNSLRNFYVTAAEALMKSIHTDLVAVKKALKEHGMKVFEEERADAVIYYRYVCRGYEDRFAMVRDVVRAEINKRITAYMVQMFR